jgi:hypothetical protein
MFFKWGTHTHTHTQYTNRQGCVYLNGCKYDQIHMSQFPQPQHKFTAARDSGTFGSIILDPYMGTLGPPFYIWKIQAWKERIFLISDPLHNFFIDPGPSEPGVSSFLMIYYGSWIHKNGSVRFQGCNCGLLDT